MKSLEERIAERKKDRERERKESLQYGNAIRRNESEEDESKDDEFDATKFISNKVEDVVAGLANLSDEELDLVSAAETSAKDRVGIHNAISELKKSRANDGGSWSKNAG